MGFTIIICSHLHSKSLVFVRASTSLMMIVRYTLLEEEDKKKIMLVLMKNLTTPSSMFCLVLSRASLFVTTHLWSSF